MVEDAHEHTAPHVDSIAHTNATAHFHFNCNIDKYLDADGQLDIHAHTDPKSNSYCDLNTHPYHLVEDTHEHAAPHMDIVADANPASYSDVYKNAITDSHKNCDSDCIGNAIANSYCIPDCIVYIHVHTCPISDADTHKNGNGFLYTVAYADTLTYAKQNSNADVYAYSLTDCILHTITYSDRHADIYGHRVIYAVKDTDDHTNLYAKPDSDMDAHADRNSNSTVRESGCLFHRQ